VFQFPSAFLEVPFMPSSSEPLPGAQAQRSDQFTEAEDLAVLRVALEQSADCIKVLDLDARLLSMNESGQRTMEIEDFSVCQHLLWPDIWHGDDRLQVEAALDRARAGQSSAFVGQCATFRGTPKWWEVRVAPLLGDTDAAERLLAVSRDITAQKQAELALKELNQGLERQVDERTRLAVQEAQAQQAFVAYTVAAGTQTDVTELAWQAIQVLQARFADASVGYYMYSQEQNLWTARAWSDDLPPETVALITAGLPCEHPVIAEVLRTRQAAFEDAQMRVKRGRPLTYQSVCMVPLLLDGEMRGLMAVGLRGTPHWSEQDRQLVEAVGRGLNLALERAAQIAGLEETAHAQQAFLAFTEEVGTQTEVRALAQQAVELLHEHLPGSSVSYQVPEVQASGTTLWKALAWNPGLPEVLLSVITAGVAGTHPVIAQIVQGRQPVFVDRWTAPPEHRLTPPEFSRTVAAYPLLQGGEVCGMLSVGLDRERPWQHQDRVMVLAVGRALNLALERAGDLRQLAERGQELEALNADLRRERTFLTTVLANLSEGVVACDEHGLLTLFNDAARTFHGLDASPLPPEQWAGHYDLFAGDGVTPLSTEQVPLYRAWKGETLREAEMVIQPRGGAARQLLASGGPMYAPDGQALGAVVTMRDVTLRRAAEQQLQDSHRQLTQSNAELQAANEELEAFAYSASHDLRTPVRHVQSFSELARKELAKMPGSEWHDGALRYLGFVEQAAGRMSTLIDAMLQLSRSTRQELRTSLLTLSTLVEQARQDLEPELAGRHIEWRVGALPVVQGDRALLQQVISNLLSNAVKFSRSVQRALIEVWTDEDADGWTVFVRDNGVGFDEKYRERLFGVFQRLHTDREFEGTGVGLATVRRIILRHGGTLAATSPPGQGATFSFSLPRTRANRTSAETEGSVPLD
jgi:PAS domain S-box-containing protein